MAYLSFFIIYFFDKVVSVSMQYYFRNGVLEITLITLIIVDNGHMVIANLVEYIQTVFHCLPHNLDQPNLCHYDFSNNVLEFGHHLENAALPDDDKPHHIEISSRLTKE